MALGGFFFDVENFLASMSVQRMSCAEIGVYVLMLCQEWRDASKSLPDNADAVADLIVLTEAKAAEVSAAWTKVRAKFVTDRRKGHEGRIYNVRLEKTRLLQAKNLKKRSAAARAGGKASAAKRQENRELDSNVGSTDVQRPSTVLFGESVQSVRSKKEPPNPLSGGTVTRADRKLAKDIRKNRFGRCTHDPACLNGVACEALIAQELADRRKSA